jgi:hypothetical protein
VRRPLVAATAPLPIDVDVEASVRRLDFVFRDDSAGEYAFEEPGFDLGKPMARHHRFRQTSFDRRGSVRRNAVAETNDRPFEDLSDRVFASHEGLL